MLQQANQPFAAEWQILGRLEIHAWHDTAHILGAFLTETLLPLALPEDLLRRIWKSAHATTLTRTQDEESAIERRIHMLIYVSPERPPGGATWGFFRIERAGATPADSTLEFYLYRDEQA